MAIFLGFLLTLLLAVYNYVKFKRRTQMDGEYYVSVNGTSTSINDNDNL